MISKSIDFFISAVALTCSGVSVVSGPKYSLKSVKTMYIDNWQACKLDTGWQHS